MILKNINNCSTCIPRILLIVTPQTNVDYENILQTLSNDRFQGCLLFFDFAVLYHNLANRALVN